MEGSPAPPGTLCLFGWLTLYINVVHKSYECWSNSTPRDCCCWNCCDMLMHFWGYFLVIVIYYYYYLLLLLLYRQWIKMNILNSSVYKTAYVIEHWIRTSWLVLRQPRLPNNRCFHPANDSAREQHLNFYEIRQIRDRSKRLSCLSKYKSKIASRVNGVKWVVYFSKLLFEFSQEKN